MLTTAGVAPKCDVCGRPPHRFDELPAREYAYLLGQYLGDGVVAHVHRGVYSLRIVSDKRYPDIIAECAAAMAAVLPTNPVGLHDVQGAVVIQSDSKAWGCLVPQHGPGRKHERKIDLAEWQQAIVNREPEQLVRGLIHSDRCRVINRVVVNGKEYAYPRYFFAQVSTDIQGIFCRALEQIGIDYSFSTRGRDVTIARRESVARLDSFVGMKS
jgi:hypothetical protein